jgi:adenylate cyclase
MPLLVLRGWADLERVEVLTRAQRLGQRLSATERLLPVVLALAHSSLAQGKYQRARDLGEQLISLAEQAGDFRHLAAGHEVTGASHLVFGELVAAREHLEGALALHAAQPAGPQTSIPLVDVTSDATGLGWLAIILWTLGYPDQALARDRQALAAARKADHPATLASVLSTTSLALHAKLRDGQAVRGHAEQLMCLARQENLAGFEAWVAFYQAWAAVAEVVEDRSTPGGQQRVKAGLAEMTSALAAFQASGMQIGRPHMLTQLVDAHLRAARSGTGEGRWAREGLQVLEGALALARESGARNNEPEMVRLRGELLLAIDGGSQAEAQQCFLQAIGLARERGARSWELRAAMSLARLRQAQGHPHEARSPLAGIYSSFTEGLDTADLRQARGLLEDLGRAA